MIHPFAYRKPRVATSFPVEFLTGHGLLIGFTRDLSEQGLSADWGEPVPLKTSGCLRLRMGHCMLELQAEVTHTEGFTTGMMFAFASEREQFFVRAMMQALAQTAVKHPV